MSSLEVIEDALGRLESKLVGYARGITGDLESARDAVQETFLRLSRQDAAALRPRLDAWLFCVCRNCALDFRRKASRTTCLTSTPESPTPDPDPARRAVIEEMSRELEEIVGELPPRQKELVFLKFHAGLSYKEMSEVLGLSVSSVGVQLHEAISSLRGKWRQVEIPMEYYGRS